jgi:hypothetical protein
MPERAASIFATVMCGVILFTSLMGVLAIFASIGETVLRSIR